MRVVSVLALFLTAVAAKSLPADIVRCSRSDPNLNRCLDVHVMEAVRKFAGGNKDLGISQLEPLLIDKIQLGDPDTLQQEYNNVQLYGITSATILNSRANFSDENCHWDYESVTPSTRMEADYKVKGRLLLFHIDGQGKCNNTLYDIQGQNSFKCEKFMKKNKTHIRITDHVFKFKPKRVVLDYDNIIAGNKQLSEEVRKTLNENSLAIYSDFGPALEKVMASVWMQNVNRVFSRVPEDELFLP
ncbi:hypothetical protein MTP99_006481 [Tenebrio molitor]|nr:hypothetical protein MTP99_006481 [Tenebrio molitor]